MNELYYFIREMRSGQKDENTLAHLTSKKIFKGELWGASY